MIFSTQKLRSRANCAETSKQKRLLDMKSRVLVGKNDKTLSQWMVHQSPNNHVYFCIFIFVHRIQYFTREKFYVETLSGWIKKCWTFFLNVVYGILTAGDIWHNSWVLNRAYCFKKTLSFARILLMDLKSFVLKFSVYFKFKYWKLLD